MKKILVIILSFLFTGLMVSCQNNPIEMSITDAFSLMNEAIENYRNAESLELDYQGNYASTLHLLKDDLRVRIKRIGSDNLVGNVSVNMVVNDETTLVFTNYQKGIIYNYTISNTQSEKLYETKSQTDFINLYTMFLKSKIDIEDTQNRSLSTTSKELTLTFDLSSNAIEKTLYVLPTMDYARNAQVVITFTEKAKLLRLSVEYEGRIDNVYGDFTYSVDFVKIDTYVIVPTLSASEISEYKEVEENEK